MIDEGHGVYRGLFRFVTVNMYVALNREFNTTERYDEKNHDSIQRSLIMHIDTLLYNTKAVFVLEKTDVGDNSM